MMGTLNKPMEPFCSSSTKKGLYYHFVLVSDKAKVLNQSEPKAEEFKVRNNSKPNTSNIKVLKKPKPRT